MNILVINSGSSSIKFQLLQMPQEQVIVTGLVERIGLKEGGSIHYKTATHSITKNITIPNHAFGLKEVAKLLMDTEKGVITNVNQIDVVGHRVVHGGQTFVATTVADKKVKAKIKELFSLAPLHNPSNLIGIEVAENIFTKAKQIAVFDTAFHQTLPQKVYQYAIPPKFLKQHHIRVYGFHGISHQYVSEQAIQLLNKPQTKIITIHLGNGCSVTAVANGKSVEHSLGFGPNEGLIMGTRSGTIDSSVILYLMNKLNYTADEVSELITKKSGMLGLTGFSDLRDIEQAAKQGNKECQLALLMNAYRIKKTIGAYATAMNGLDAIVFTAGIGENSCTMRALVCEEMTFLGIALDEIKNNEKNNENRAIQAENSKVKIYVIPTNEELQIAKECFTKVNSNNDDF